MSEIIKFFRKLKRDKKELDNFLRIFSTIPIDRNKEENFQVVKKTLHSYFKQILDEIRKHWDLDMIGNYETYLRRSILNNSEIAIAFYNYYLLLSDYLELNRKNPPDKRKILLDKIKRIRPNLELDLTPRDLSSKYNTTLKVLARIFDVSPKTIERLIGDVRVEVAYEYVLFYDLENIKTDADLLKRFEQLIMIRIEEIKKINIKEGKKSWEKDPFLSGRISELSEILDSHKILKPYFLAIEKLDKRAKKKIRKEYHASYDKIFETSEFSINLSERINKPLGALVNETLSKIEVLNTKHKK